MISITTWIVRHYVDCTTPHGLYDTTWIEIKKTSNKIQHWRSIVLIQSFPELWLHNKVTLAAHFISTLV